MIIILSSLAISLWCGVLIGRIIASHASECWKLWKHFVSVVGYFLKQCTAGKLGRWLQRNLIQQFIVLSWNLLSKCSIVVHDSWWIGADKVRAEKQRFLGLTWWFLTFLKHSNFKKIEINIRLEFYNIHLNFQRLIWKKSIKLHVCLAKFIIKFNFGKRTRNFSNFVQIA